MFRKFSLFTACALAIIFCAPSRGQDSPSLGDIARKAQKDKANKPAAKVITNDDMPAKSSSSPAASLAAGPSPTAQPGAAGNAGDPQSPAEGLEKLQSQVDDLDSLDRASLASSVLEGNTANFPGRAKWEEKLYAAKQNFVSQERGVLHEIRQIETASEGMKNIQDPNDPRIKAVSAKLQEIVQQSQQDSAAFQAVVAEGKSLAGQK